jgi:hypothetical protein
MTERDSATVENPEKLHLPALNNRRAAYSRSVI